MFAVGCSRKHNFMVYVMVTKQNFARRETVPIDDVAFDFSFMKEDTYNKQPPKGVYTHGLFFDGARWNKEKGLIDDPLPKVLFSPAPIIWMEPKETKDLSEYQHYKCPVYIGISVEGLSL